MVEASSCEAASTPTLSVTSAEPTATSAKAATTKAAAEATTAAEASSATEAHPGVCEPVRTHLEDAALPIVAIELLDRISSVVGGFEHHDTRSLGSPVRPQMNIGADDTASAGCYFV